MHGHAATGLSGVMHGTGSSGPGPAGGAMKPASLMRRGRPRL